MIEYPSPLECIKFIVRILSDTTHSKNTADKIGFYWNIKFDFGAMFASALTDKKRRKQFLEDGKTLTILDGKERYFKIKYYGGKGFTIQPWVLNHKGTRWRSQKTLRFYDAMMNYKAYGPSASLDYVSQSFGMSAKDSGIDRVRLGNEEGYYEAHRERIIEYCIEDCRKTLRLAEIARDGFADMMQDLFGKQIYAKYYFSAASFGKAWLDLRHLECRNWLYKNMSLEEIEFILNCYFGGIFDVKQFGLFSHTKPCKRCSHRKSEPVFHPATEIDIVSAYPSAIRTIRKLDQLVWRRTNKYSPKAEFGFYLIRTHLNGLLPVKTGCNFSMYPDDPTTLAETYVTTWTLRWLIKHSMYYEVIEAIEFVSDDMKQPEYEFKEDIELMFARRAEIKKQMKDASGDEYHKLDSMQLALKLILNTGGYGCHASMRKHCSAYSNVVLSALITDYCRAKISEIAWQVGYQNIIFIATDAICFIDHGQKFDASIVFGDDLGNVEYALNKGEVMVLKNGFYWIRSCSCTDLEECQRIADEEYERIGEKTPHLKWRTRGFESLDVQTLLKTKKDQQKVRVYTNRSDTIIQGAIKNNMSKVAKIGRGYKTFDLKSNKNRRHIEDYFMMTFQNLMNSCFPTQAFMVGDEFVNEQPIHQNLTKDFKEYYERVKKYDTSAPHPRASHPELRPARNKRYWDAHHEVVNAKRRAKRASRTQFNAVAERLPHPILQELSA